jgi:hypothetical protein
MKLRSNIDYCIRRNVEKNIGILTTTGGKFVAEGVTFTGAQAIKGHWNGIRFDDCLPGSIVNDCTIEYAGREHGW